jgi:hypothetical protein
MRNAVFCVSCDLVQLTTCPSSVVFTMLEKDRTMLKSAAASADSLQLRALRALSPPTEGLGKKLSNEGTNPRNDENQASSVHSNDAQSGDVSDGRGSKPRISRPTFIRRPKLVGKSVEGAAMQAVAASRARASNKQRFPSRGTMTAGTSNQPQKVARDATTRESARLASGDIENKTPGAPSLSTSQAMLESDASLVAARKAFCELLAGPSTILRGWSSQRLHAMQKLAKSWWPRKDITTIPRSVCEFIVSRSPRTWSDVREVPPVCPRLLNSLSISLAQTIRMWNPGILLVPVPSQDMGKSNSALLMSEMRAVRSCRFVVIVKIGIFQVGGKGRQRNLLRVQGWLVSMPRHLKDSRNECWIMSTALSEKDAAGVDKLAMELHVSSGMYRRVHWLYLLFNSLFVDIRRHRLTWTVSCWISWDISSRGP